MANSCSKLSRRRTSVATPPPTSTSAGRRYDALLFDLDGTLIDSMPLHQRAWARWLAEQGQPLEEDARFFASTAGRSGAEILAGMFPQADAAEIERLSDEREAL